MKPSRRTFLRSIPIICASIVAASWWFLNERRQTIGSQISTEKKPVQSQTMSISSETATTQPESGATTGEPFEFQVTWNGDGPTQVNLEDYRLTVDGDVSNPLQLSIEDLRRMPSVEKTVNIACVTGWNTNVPWAGILLSYLLNQAGAPKNIDHLTFESVTGYTTDISGSQLTNPDNMIALKAGDAPLSEAHGYPARLVLPTRAGEDWVKYVRRITCTKM